MVDKSEESIKGNFKKPCGCGCGVLIWHLDKKYRIRNFEYHHSTSSGKKHPNWKGGSYKTKKKYIKELRKGHRRADKIGYVFQHILVYEETLNCCLLDGVDIHHKDKNPKNNNFNNLEPITHEDHSKYYTFIDYQIRRSNNIKDLSPRHIERSWLLWSWLLGLKRLKNQYDKRIR